jgi:hypothetical protein
MPRLSGALAGIANPANLPFCAACALGSCPCHEVIE